MPLRTTPLAPDPEQLPLLYFYRQQLDIAIKSLEAIQRLRENHAQIGTLVRGQTRRRNG